MKTTSTFDGTYPYEEFCIHFDDLQHGDYFGRDRSHDDSNEEPYFEKSMMVVMDYMHERYPDKQESFFKGSRYVLIMNYLSHHMNDFDRSDYAVFGSEKVGSLASDHLLKALHFFYTSPKLISENKDPTPEEVMAIADSFRNVK